MKNEIPWRSKVQRDISNRTGHMFRRLVKVGTVMQFRKNLRKRNITGLEWITGIHKTYKSTDKVKQYVTQ